MTLAFLGTHSQTMPAGDEVVPSQAEIEREIAKLEEDSARDVQRQLKQQRLAAKEGKVEECVKKVEGDVERSLAPLWRAAEQDVETFAKDTEANVRDLRRRKECVKSCEGK